MIAAILTWLEDRTGLGNAVGKIMRHRVPRGSGWLYVFGSATLMAFLLQLVTGAALATVYVPSAGDAYQSLQYITEQAMLGRFLRGMHYFGASAMIILIGVHMIRVFLTGSYKFPREMSWLSGVLLFALTISMAFTGQVLRWDQDGVWSAVIAAEQSGRVPFVGRILGRFLLSGDNISGETLSHFFAYHVFVIPGLVIGLIVLHLYLVIRNGISEPPRIDQPVKMSEYRAWYRKRLVVDGESYWPAPFLRDVTFGVGILLIIAALALMFGPRRLGLPPDPSLMARDPRPDWYLMWYFALLAVLPPRLENWFIWLFPMGAGLVLVALPFLSPSGQRHPARRPWAWLFVVCLVALVAVLSRLGLLAPWNPRPDPPQFSAAMIASDDPVILRGAALFQSHACGSCHVIDGIGGHRGPDLSHAGDRLSLANVTLRIAAGGKNMPAFGRHLSAEELLAIAKFVMSRTAQGGQLHEH